jgi:hypothetical protein
MHRLPRRILHLGFVSVVLSSMANVSSAQAPPAEPAIAPAPAPYSLPWQLRPAAVATVVRSDTAVAFFDGADGEGGSTIASTLLGSYKLSKHFAPMVRVAVVRHAPPAGEDAVAFANPVVGATYLRELAPGLRLTAFLGVALPLGSGGGNDPDPAAAAAMGASVPARSAMDNAMFAVNDLTVFPGVGLAYVKGGLTLQAEATILQLTRVRGDEVQADSSKTNFTCGVHAGWFFHPMISAGVDLRLQRWLSTPSFVEADDSRRETITFAVGPRLHFKLADSRWFRPGIAYIRGLDDPMSASSYDIVQIDLPLSF